MGSFSGGLYTYTGAARYSLGVPEAATSRLLNSPRLTETTVTHT